MSIKKIFNHMANPYITCDTKKCGQCAKEEIRGIVAKEFIDSNRCNTNEDFESLEKEVQKKWIKHPIYLMVREIMNQGKTLEVALEEVRKLGIDP